MFFVNYLKVISLNCNNSIDIILVFFHHISITFLTIRKKFITLQEISDKLFVCDAIWQNFFLRYPEFTSFEPSFLPCIFVLSHIVISFCSFMSYRFAHWNMILLTPDLSVSEFDCVSKKILNILFYFKSPIPAK